MGEEGIVETTSTEGESSTTEEEGTSVVVYIDLWVFVSLLLACAVIHLRHHVKLPKSGMLLLAGIFLRCVGQYIGMLEDTVKLLDDIEAETILLIFLPALISECAFETDWYTFKREFGQITLLATTAVIVSSVLTAIIVRYILGFESDFGWYSALMLGAILSATDHVAVVAQLKEVNADERLETLIQGETLVNDGTVIVVFTTMMKGATGSATNAGDIVELFFRLSLGGVAMGIGFGLLLSFWLKRLFNDTVLETLLTLVTTYLLFFTADATEVHFSGALGTVTFGLYMSAYGKTMISPRVEKSVHEFWTLLGTCFEALTLILGGMLMGHFFINFEELENSDIGALFGLFALLHIVRAATVLLHWPLLRIMGYGCTTKEMLVLVFGALKGTISIALSLMVFHNDHISSRVRDLVLFWSVGVSALSVCFDSIILHVVVRVLGLESLTDVQENMLISVTTSILATAEKKMKKLRNDHDYALANWEEVMKDSGPETLLKDMINVTKNGKKMTEPWANSTAGVLEQFGRVVNINEKDIVLETRRRFYTTLKGIYWHLFEEGQCFGNSALIMIESANRGLDSQHEPMNDWPLLEKKVFPRKLLKAVHWMSRAPLIGWIFERIEYSYITEAYDICRNFIRAHHEAEELLDDMEIDIEKKTFEEVMKEPHQQIALAKQFLNDNIMDIYPEVYIFVQTKQVSSILLHSERESIEEAYERGVITEIEYSELSESVARKIRQLERHSRPKHPTLIELLRSCELFADLPKDTLQKLATGLKEEVIHKGEELLESGGVYVVLKGRVREDGKVYSLEHSAGEVVGLQHLLPNYDPPQASATTMITSKVVFVPKATVTELLANEDFERRLWMLGAKKILQISRESFGELGLLELEKQNIVFKNSSIVKYAAGDEVPLSAGAMLLDGGLSTGEKGLTYIPGRDKVKAVASEACHLLQFNEEFGKFLRTSETDLKSAVTKFELQGKGPSLKMGNKKIGDVKALGAMLFKKAIPGLDASKVQPVNVTSLDGETRYPAVQEPKAKASGISPMFSMLKTTTRTKEEQELLPENPHSPLNLG